MVDIIYEMQKLSDKLLDVSATDPLFLRAILFLLVFILIYLPLEKTKLFEKSKSTRIITALIVSILATIYISETQIYFLLTNYNILGILLITFLPLALLLIFTHRSNMAPIGRKFVLGLFGLVLVYTWFKQSREFQEIETNILIITGAITIASIIFDKTLHKIFKKQIKK